MSNLNLRQKIVNLYPQDKRLEVMLNIAKVDKIFKNSDYYTAIYKILDTIGESNSQYIKDEVRELLRELATENRRIPILSIYEGQNFELEVTLRNVENIADYEIRVLDIENEMYISLPGVLDDHTIKLLVADFPYVKDTIKKFLIVGTSNNLEEIDIVLGQFFVVTDERVDLGNFNFGTVDVPPPSGESTGPYAIYGVMGQEDIYRDDAIGGGNGRIVWSTSKRGDSRIVYSANNRSFNKTYYNNYKTYFHEFILTGLNVDSTYYFKVESTNDLGNTLVSDVYWFKTGKDIAILLSNLTSTYNSVKITPTNNNINMLLPYSFEQHQINEPTNFGDQTVSTNSNAISVTNNSYTSYKFETLVEHTIT